MNSTVNEAFTIPVSFGKSVPFILYLRTSLGKRHAHLRTLCLCEKSCEPSLEGLLKQRQQECIRNLTIGFLQHQSELNLMKWIKANSQTRKSAVALSTSSTA